MSLQIPSPSRPVSAAVAQTSPQNRRQPPQHRASHQVVSSTPDHEQQPQPPAFTDVYSHPAAIAYAAAHPRRTIPKFGPYLLLQTLGEGEFGKVKLGLHSQWGEEVAVKLIRRGNVDTAVRMSKVEREIEVLRTLKHPNIVRLYDVIETDKYIGIIIEYASGGELFDHILAHRYLRERDASKLFSQLISGVWYIHQKKIVHRDLKLENLLLDRHRNVIITDFGFANRFEHKADDLMQTSCGSPCYAAPELVISEGLYVGSAVDIWSCGVILYAMLAGYLPFDDDPANPDGDNINLLYKYIVNTPLSFPEYISDEARDLLKMMLVPDPRRRASLEAVMRHPWLGAYHQATPTDPSVPSAFGSTVDELELAAMDQHQMKRLAYQRQMRAAATAQSPATTQITRSQTQTNSHALAQNQGRRLQPETLYSSTSGDDDPFASSPAARRPADGTLEEGVARGEPRQRGEDGEVLEAARKGKEAAVDGQSPRKGKEKEDRFRHTIQVEPREHRARAGSSGREREQEGVSATPPRERRERSRSRTPTQVRGPAAEASPVPVPPPVSTPPSALATPASNGAEGPVAPSQTTSPSQSIAERRERRRRGSTSSGVAVGATSPASKPLPPSPPSTWNTQSPTKSVVGPGETVNGTAGPAAERMAVMDVFSDGQKEMAQPAVPEAVPEMVVEKAPEQEGEGERVAEKKEKDPKKIQSRRNTLTGLTVMVNPINSIRANIASRKQREPSTTTSTTPPIPLGPPSALAPHTGSTNKIFEESGAGAMKASTSKARKVMQWIRKGRDSLTVGGPVSAGPSPAGSVSSTGDAGDAVSPVQVYVTTPNSATQPTPPVRPPIVTANVGRQDAPSPLSAMTPTPVSATPSFASRFRRSVNLGGSGGGSSGGTIKGSREGPTAGSGGVLRIHHGAVDQGTITSGPPPEVMRHVKEVLDKMGMEIHVESEYKFRCIRAKQRRSGRSSIGITTAPQGVAAFTMAGSAGSNGVDKRGLPLPSQASFSSGGMLRGLLMRRQSSQVSAAAPGSTSFDGDDSLNSTILTAEPVAQADTIYGGPSQDAGDEVRFSVELTRLQGLNDTYSLDIRRLKGNLRSYKFLYDTLRIRADLQR
ncbi:Pkinase-domain-containing protein [Mycena pura]|uniref:non-specific serine/threonine protein kinase n=1 Tax=Mycena pura TaxID=153505 RepID=A0AAD6UTA4_9AGAR|nr:Pkinase-domain-containing protein [Mycena pura]